MDVEMETEDEAVHANAEQENVKQARQPPTTDEVAIRLQHFVLKTVESSAGLEAGIKCNKTQAALAACRKVTDSLFQLMESKIPIDEPSACLSVSRNTAGRLAAILSDECGAGNIRDMCVGHLVSMLGKVLELADTLAGIPVALSDAVLRSTRLELKKYAENHSEDWLTKMENMCIICIDGRSR
ncbi:hypothetical protein JG688_00010416 [Phytophthora aleatoria]|uniref:Uncharacterized protein n=1 Tax=Phytophthora aleatoria TaxID=2496075 RepID=A0A8J5M3C6_9STRA|nr:hypothetical protein JG688_00010416 [Phytophthora aleatoria]